MKIGFDARMIRHSGIGTYIRGILNHLTARENLDFTLFGDPLKIADYPAKKVLADFPIYSVREQLFFPRLLKKSLPDLLHVPHYNAPVGFRGNLVITIHDLIHLRFPPSRLAYIYARLMLETVCRKARIIIADSLNTKKDILELLGIEEKKVRVIYPGVGWTDDGERKDEGKYLLYVGMIKPHKNIKVLIQAFLKAREKIEKLQLVLAGKNFMSDYSDQFNGRKEIQFLGEVSQQKLVKIYRGAKLFVFPSLYEGFGLPPLEAMACGIPTICSNAASLPEAVGEAAALFNPMDSKELAEIIIELWENEQKRRVLAERGRAQAKRFSWQKCASEIEKVYGEVLTA